MLVMHCRLFGVFMHSMWWMCHCEQQGGETAESKCTSLVQKQNTLTTQLWARKNRHMYCTAIFIRARNPCSVNTIILLWGLPTSRKCNIELISFAFNMLNNIDDAIGSKDLMHAADVKVVWCSNLSMHCLSSRPLVTMHPCCRLDTVGEKPRGRSWHSFTALPPFRIVLYGGFSQTEEPLCKWAYANTVFNNRLSFGECGRVRRDVSFGTTEACTNLTVVWTEKSDHTTLLCRTAATL